MSNPLLLNSDLASITLTVPASAVVAATAGAAGNNVAVVGLTIDRETLLPNGAAAPVLDSLPAGAMFDIWYECALGAGDTITLKAALLQDSTDGTTWATVYDQTGATGPVPPDWPSAGVVDTGRTGGSTQRGVLVFGTPISRCRRYVRFGFTPSLSAASVDTGTFTVFGVLSGPQS